MYYYSGGNFYDDESCDAAYLVKNDSGVNITTMSEMVRTMSNGDKIYMMSGYSVSGTEVVSTNTNITIERYNHANATSNAYSLFSVSVSGNFTFISGDDGSITIDGGNVSVATANGGAFNNAGTLTLGSESSIYENIIIKNNVVQNAGGGIYNTGTANLYNCNISNNSTAQNGGGIYNTGTCDLNNITITDNAVNANGNKGGGGIYDSGVVRITNKIVVANNKFNSNKGSKDNNIYLMNGTIIIINGILLDGTNIGITTRRAPGTTGTNIATGAGENKESYANDYFFADEPSYNIGSSNNGDYIVIYS